MSFAPFKGRFRSLRYRLLVWNTLVAFLLVGGCLLLVHQSTHFARLELLDLFLDDELDTVCSEIAAHAGPPDALHAALDRQAANHPRRKLFVQLLGADGSVLWGSVHSPQQPIPHDLPFPRQSPITWEDYRLLERRLPAQGGRHRLVRVGVSLEYFREEMRRVTEVVVSVGAVFLLICPAAAFLLTTRAMRPLGKIVRTINRVVPGNLNERLPVRDGGGELDQIAATINGLLDRLNQYIQMNRSWLTDAAHELRSPLASIRVSLELAVSHERSAEEYRDAIEEMLPECDNLITILNKMLLLGESDGGILPLRKEPVALDQLAERSLEMYQAVAEANRVELRAGPLEPVTVMGDRQLLAQVLNNLLDNALKYTPAGGAVAVQLSMLPDRTAACLTVTDTGVGIAPEDVPHLFERFFRGDKSRERCGPRGHGLGLSLCQTFVRAHGGSIQVASTPGKGSAFTVVLPLTQEPA